jgi:hypothetical protein
MVMNYEERFPKLEYFLGCSFHQEGLAVLDWQGREPNDRDAVCFYKVTEEPELIRQVAKELREFLRLPLTEEEIKKAVWSFGITRNPANTGRTFRGWLEEVLEVLEDPTANTSYLRYAGFPMEPDWNKHAKK